MLYQIEPRRIRILREQLHFTPHPLGKDTLNSHPVTIFFYVVPEIFRLEVRLCHMHRCGRGLCSLKPHSSRKRVVPVLMHDMCQHLR